MTKFNIRFVTKLSQEQALFKRRTLEMEKQTKELESKHQLLEEERELECWAESANSIRKWRCSYPINQTEKLPLCWFTIKKGFIQVVVIYRSLNWTTLIEIISKGMSGLVCTVDQRPMPGSEKMSYLRTLLTGTAKSALSGMGYSGQFYDAAWCILERKFVRPHVIIDAKLESLRKASQVNSINSPGLINSSVIVFNFANLLKEYKQWMVCNQARHCICYQINYFKFPKRRGGSMLMVKMKTGLILILLKNGYVEWHSFLRRFQLSRESIRRKTIEHKQRQTGLEDIKLQRKFKCERNEANAKWSLSTSWWFETANYSETWAWMTGWQHWASNAYVTDVRAK